MSEFQRTPAGLVAKYHFFNVPLVWVEGYSDIPFYVEALRGVVCRVEPAGGKQECQILARALLTGDLPYVVVVDGDYKILERSRPSRSRFIYLRRYSFENYLCELRAVEGICRDYNYDSVDLVKWKFDELLKTVHENLFDLVALDAAHVLGQTGKRVLPDAADALLESRTGCRLSGARIAELERSAGQSVESRNVIEIRRRLEEFCAKRRLIDILRGRLSFGLLRRLVLSLIETGGRRAPQLDKESLRLLFIKEIWRKVEPRSDHLMLKRKLRNAVRSAARQRTVETASKTSSVG